MINLITVDSQNNLIVPKEGTVIPIIIGDGVGPDIWQASEPVLTKAAKLAGHKLEFVEALAGQAAFKACGQYLPDETLETLKKFRVTLKGPLATPVGGGMRSLNVGIRQALDLYACVRPIKWIPGVPSPVKEPHKADMILFRENTEDLYAGIEWPAGSQEAQELIAFLTTNLKAKVRPNSALGIKPMSEFGSKRLIKMAMDWALREKRSSLTLVHKGNIMKFTEGAFRKWGYELAASDYAEQSLPEESWDGQPSDRLIIKDRIADNMFMQSLLRPEEYSVLAMPNLNGDYLSDCLAAQIGGLGMAPGANIGDGLAVFEATHGTAPKYAGQDKVNPSSLILSGAFMLDYLGWKEASKKITKALELVVSKKILTYDLARQVGVSPVKCSEFGQAVADHLE
ncbi:MAG: NADP-dependent isocitrate dehydrogenase [Deltaproteobacteria bacterium]|jgi:isocitrate dehydrogenase|nr:NADP-dependent isocitrate dehydrogenase [Deltaproteobacteria bacterium]